MRSIVLACVLGLWIWAAAWGQAEEPLTLDPRPTATQGAPVPEIPQIEPKIEPLQLRPTEGEPAEGVPAPAPAGTREPAAGEPADVSTETAPAAPTTAAASQPLPLRIAGLPAREWLNTPGSIRAGNLEGRMWVVAVLEPWSSGSWQAATDLAKVAKDLAGRGVDVYLVSVAPADEVRKGLISHPMEVPIGAASKLPLVVPLDPLPQVYLVGPDYYVRWHGTVGNLAQTASMEAGRPGMGGLTQERENELTNWLNRAKAAANSTEPAAQTADRYFIATGLAAAVADATPGNHPLHLQAVALLGQLDQRGEQLLGQAREAVKADKAAEAHDLLQRIAEGFYGRPAGTQALRMLQEVEKNPEQQAAVQAARDEVSARQALQMAQDALTAKRYADAERYYRMIGEVYPRTQATGKARQALAELRKDKAAATQLAAQKAEPDAPVLLSLAARYTQTGRAEEARRCYERVVQMAPGTTYAKQAQEGLALLPGAATQKAKAAKPG